jgi:transposase
VSGHKPTLYLALELGWSKWKLAFASAPAEKPSRREVEARNIARLLSEIAAAKRKLGLPADCPVVSCYEAGRDGFWIHRWLETQEVQNVIVDSSSIEVNRRARRAKSDSLDAAKLLSMLFRHAGGEKVWSIVRVPTEEEEHARQLHRELQSLGQESTRHINRIKGLLASIGLEVEVDKHFPLRLKELRQWNGKPVPEELQGRLLRDFERLQVINRQIRALNQQRNKTLRTKDSPVLRKVQRFLSLRGIGVNSAWLYVYEFFGWRKFKNRREVGALAGLAPTPYSSGDLRHEQGISKAGNRRMRWMAVEIAWWWLHFQPDSALSKWYLQRFAKGNSRQRRIGIVALARKLLVALWKYLETGEVPDGAELVDWQAKTRTSIRSLDLSPMKRRKAS